jgi:hypothetical protein
MLTARRAAELIDRVDQTSLRLVEVLTTRKIDKLTRPIETTLEAKLAKLFIRQGNVLARQLKPLNKYLTESASEDFDDLFDSATLETSADMQDAIEASVNASVLVGGKSLISDFNSKVVFSLTNPRAVAYTKNRAAEAIAGIDQTSKDDIRRLVVLAVEHGTSYSELARQIKARYNQFAIGVPQKHIRSRAELIAITETGNAYQAGNFVAAQIMKDGGLTLEKYWYNRGDDRVSDGCLANTAIGWIDLDTAFPSGDMTPLRFPGCRCAAQYRRKKD